nr:MAG TPA: hypothetical protein [Caudoviricetes sp.]
MNCTNIDVQLVGPSNINHCHGNVRPYTILYLIIYYLTFPNIILVNNRVRTFCKQCSDEPKP